MLKKRKAMRENEQPSVFIRVYGVRSMAAASTVRAARAAASAALITFFLPYQIRYYKSDDDQQYAADDVGCHTPPSYPGTIFIAGLCRSRLRTPDAGN